MGKETREDIRIVFEVPGGYSDQARLDAYLVGCIQNATRTKVARGIADGRVSVNGKIIRKSSYRVQANDQIACTISRLKPIRIVPEEIPLQIVHEDEFLIVLVKPAGMVVHPAYGHRSGTLVNALLYHLGKDTIVLEDDGEELQLGTAEDERINSTLLRPGIVHRLDKDTSGLMVVAKDSQTLSALGRQFHDHTIGRRYKAIAWGIPSEQAGRIETYLGRSSKDRRMIAVTTDGVGKWAVTNYSVSEEHIYTSVIDFELETGRTHQIRVHAAHIGHPIFGDSTYGGNHIRFGPVTKNRTAFHRNLFSLLPGQALHAEHLSFEHPGTGSLMSFDQPCPEPMQLIINRLRVHSG